MKKRGKERGMRREKEKWRDRMKMRETDGSKSAQRTRASVGGGESSRRVSCAMRKKEREFIC